MGGMLCIQNSDKESPAELFSKLQENREDEQEAGLVQMQLFH